MIYLHKSLSVLSQRQVPCLFIPPLLNKRLNKHVYYYMQYKWSTIFINIQYTAYIIIWTPDYIIGWRYIDMIITLCLAHLSLAVPVHTMFKQCSSNIVVRQVSGLALIFIWVYTTLHWWLLLNKPVFILIISYFHSILFVFLLLGSLSWWKLTGKEVSRIGYI